MASAAQEPDARPPGARREGRGRRLPRCRPRPGRAGDRLGSVRQRRPDVRVRGAGLRRGRRSPTRSRDRVVEETRRLRLGNPAAGEVEIGPMTLERQRRIVEEHVADAVAKGARVLTGGVRPVGPGYFFPPTVLTNVDHSMRVMTEETFGPVLPIVRVAVRRRGRAPRQRQRLRPHRQRLDARPGHRAPARRQRLSAGVVTHQRLRLEPR